MSTNIRTERMLSVADCARIGAVSRGTILNHIRSGKLRAAKVGKNWRATAKAVREWAGIPEDEPLPGVADDGGNGHAEEPTNR